jgi:ubiquitin-conjugating enzyme E2 Z
MSRVLMKRLMRDIKNLKTGQLDGIGIYYNVNERDIRKIKCMIIGTPDTPYEYGYYMFDIYIEDDYPFKPPSVKYQTRKTGIRFNPNLYTCGKVCLSIINTWMGPQWTSCQSPRSIMISLQTLLHENPLHNEPGYENCYDTKNKNYNEVIKHENYSFSIYEIIKNGLVGFECFSNEIRKHFVQNYETIFKNLDELIEHYQHQPIFTSNVYPMNVKNNYHKIKANLIDLYGKMICSNPEILQIKMDYEKHKMSNTEIKTITNTTTKEQKTKEQKTKEQKTKEQKTKEQKTKEQKTKEQKTKEQKTKEQKTKEQKKYKQSCVKKKN